MIHPERQITPVVVTVHPKIDPYPKVVNDGRLVITHDNNKNKPPKEWKQHIKQWMFNFSSYSTFHGFAWYNRTDIFFLKMLIFWAAMIITFALPMVVFTEFGKFLKDNRMNTAVEWRAADTVIYPNITICHTLNFNSEKLRRFNISDALANYMTLAIDPSSGTNADYMAQQFPPGVYLEWLNEFDRELNTILKENNMTDLMQLFQMVAVSCEETIFFCEVHRKFYGATYLNDPLPCCGKLFDVKPIFSQAGTCFTTNQQILETTPTILSSIRIWVTVDKSKSPKYDLKWKGSDAAMREGIYWTLSYEDHPGWKILTSPKTAALGSSTIVALTKYEDDRTGLSEKCMTKGNETFKAMFGLDSTRMNCEMLTSHFVVANCSVGVYSGLKQVGNLGPCMPSDTLHYNAQKEGIDDAVALKYGYSSNMCNFDCFHSYYSTSISNGKFDGDSLQRFFTDPAAALIPVVNQSTAIPTTGLPTPETSLVIQFYFESFDHPKNVMYTEGFFDFLSKIGGWMSISIGASVVSFIEIVGFHLHLGKGLLKTICGN